jgi:hypothetical protein
LKASAVSTTTAKPFEHSNDQSCEQAAHSGCAEAG